LSLYISIIWICFGFRYSNFEFMENFLYFSREIFTKSPLFMQNKPNFPLFSPKIEDFIKKQTQFKPNSNPILAQKSGWQTQTNPIQTQFKDQIYTKRGRAKNNNTQAALFPFTSDCPWCYNYSIRNIHIVTENSMKGTGDE